MVRLHFGNKLAYKLASQSADIKFFVCTQKKFPTYVKSPPFENQRKTTEQILPLNVYSFVPGINRSLPGVTKNLPVIPVIIRNLFDASANFLTVQGTDGYRLPQQYNKMCMYNVHVQHYSLSFMTLFILPIY
jgi:hypothetical protein